MFINTYKENLKEPQCHPDCLGELCGGWSQETFRQIVLKMTKKGKIPIKLWFDSAEEMAVLSNKKNALAEIFNYMDTKKRGRIDTMELFALIFLALEGKMETKLNNAMNFFGFNHRSEFARDEFHYYLDCLFRGIMKFAIPSGSKTPTMAGKNVRQGDI